MNTEQLFMEIDRHFLGKLEYPKRFTAATSQVDGWFKGELIYLFTSLQQRKGLEEWAPEVLVPGQDEDKKKRVDFRVKLDNGFAWLEIKCLYWGPTRAQQPTDLSFYFSNDPQEVRGDVLKLASIKEGIGYCIIFIYPGPERDQWQEILTKFKEKAGDCTFKEKSSISQFPKTLCIAKLEIAQGTS